MASKPVSLPLPVQSNPEEEKKCPPPGAPAWMATFADIAILLMAFFVLILSFAEFNQPKFKQVAGSLRLAFGVQRDTPVLEQPRGTTILELNFSPSPEVSILDEMKQDTVDETRPEIVSSVEGEASGTGQDGEAEEQAAQVAEAIAETVSEALQEDVIEPDVEVAAREGALVLDFENVSEENLPERLAAAAEALAEALTQAESEAGLPQTQVLLDGLENELQELAQAAAREAEAQRDAENSERTAAISAAELTVALRQEIGAGLVAVEQREDKVIVTVGEGGSFRSGRSELTPAAREIMARIAATAMDDASDIVVTGHTDSVPLSPASPYRDNWGLAAARAASVVRELEAASGIPSGRMSALSRGETVPVASNDTAEGREQNRRIEIEFQY